MSKPDFEKMARGVLGIPDHVNYPGIAKHATALQAAYDAGLERAAEIASQSDKSTHPADLADAIRAEKSQ